MSKCDAQPSAMCAQKRVDKSPKRFTNETKPVSALKILENHGFQGSTFTRERAFYTKDDQFHGKYRDCGTMNCTLILFIAQFSRRRWPLSPANLSHVKKKTQIVSSNTQWPFIIKCFLALIYAG